MSRVRGLRHGALLSLLVGALFAAPDPAVADELRALETFDAAWEIVRRAFYDPRLHGVDWDAARDRHRPEAARAASRDELQDALRGLLAELGASHTTVLDAETYAWTMAELENRRVRTFGVVLEECEPDRLFVRALYEGGPGARAGLCIGDLVTTVDGVPAPRSPLLRDAGYDPALPGRSRFWLSADGKGSVRLEVQGTPDPASRRGVEVRSRRMNAVDAAKNSVAVVERDGVRLGTMHVWFCSRGIVEAVSEALEGPLAGCDALVLDVRGRGGYRDVADALGRLFRRDESVGVWDKPLVVLIDGRTRSGKEVFAHDVRRKRLGWLVGERTEGAVLGASFHRLPDGSVLELAAMEVPVAGGARLEGVGVAPHHAVSTGSPALPFSAGDDPIFEKGCEIAVRAVRRGTNRPTVVGPY